MIVNGVDNFGGPFRLLSVTTLNDDVHEDDEDGKKMEDQDCYAMMTIRCALVKTVPYNNQSNNLPPTLCHRITNLRLYLGCILKSLAFYLSYILQRILHTAFDQAIFYVSRTFCLERVETLAHAFAPSESHQPDTPIDSREESIATDSME